MIDWSPEMKWKRGLVPRILQQNSDNVRDKYNVMMACSNGRDERNNGSRAYINNWNWRKETIRNTHTHAQHGTRNIPNENGYMWTLSTRERESLETGANDSFCRSLLRAASRKNCISDQWEDAHFTRTCTRGWPCSLERGIQMACYTDLQ